MLTSAHVCGLVYTGREHCAPTLERQKKLGPEIGSQQALGITQSIWSESTSSAAALRHSEGVNCVCSLNVVTLRALGEPKQPHVVSSCSLLGACIFVGLPSALERIAARAHDLKLCEPIPESSLDPIGASPGLPTTCPRVRIPSGRRPPRCCSKVSLTDGFASTDTWCSTDRGPVKCAQLSGVVVVYPFGICGLPPIVWSCQRTKRIRLSISRLTFTLHCHKRPVLQ